MQPKRDPNDRRYWPVREGGTGRGFGRVDKRDNPQHFAAIKDMSPIEDTPDSMVSVHKRGRTAEGIRTRSRLILELALDKLEGRLDDAGVKDLNGAIAALGRIAGVQSTDVNIQGSVAHLHLDALRAPRKLNSDNVLDSAKLINTVEEVNTAASLPRGDASI